MNETDNVLPWPKKPMISPQVFLLEQSSWQPLGVLGPHTTKNPSITSRTNCFL